MSQDGDSRPLSGPQSDEQDSGARRPNDNGGILTLSKNPGDGWNRPGARPVLSWRTDMPDSTPIPSWRIAVGGFGPGLGTRSRPSAATMRKILAEQNGRCLYCDFEFGVYTTRKDRPLLVRVNWDHFIPFVYAQQRHRVRWVAACATCNLIKHAKIFDTVAEAREFIQAERGRKGYESCADPLINYPRTEDEAWQRARRRWARRPSAGSL